MSDGEFFSRQLEQLRPGPDVKVDQAAIAALPPFVVEDDPAPVIVSAGRGYRCLNLGCPERAPVRASAPPTCYTCARPMAEVHAPVTSEEIAKLKAGTPPMRVVDFFKDNSARDLQAAADWAHMATSVNRAALAHGLRWPSVAAVFVPMNQFKQGVTADETNRRRIRQAAKVAGFSDAFARGEAVHRELEGCFLPRSSAPADYDVAGLEHGRTYDTEQRPLRTNHVAIVDDAWRCTRPGCPERAPVRASTAPTCYTCQQPMATVKTELRWKPLVVTRPSRDLDLDAMFRPPTPLDPGIGPLIDDLKRRLVEASAMPAGVLLGRAPTERCERRWFAEVMQSAPCTVRFAGRTIRGCHVTVDETPDGLEWSVAVGHVNDNVAGALEHLWRTREFPSALYAGESMLTEHAVMTSLSDSCTTRGTRRAVAHFKPVLQKTP